MNRYAAALCLMPFLWCGKGIAQLYNRSVLRDWIYSTILNEERYLDIAVPKEFAGAEVPQAVQATRIGVLYVLGEPYIASNIEHYLEIEFIPPQIVVSIGGSPKERSLKNSDATGGRDAFLAFITTELMPYINQKYRNSGKNILFGHSIGGLFAMYALLKSPRAFTGYILADPSFFWNNNEMQTLARDKVGSLSDTARFLFIAGRGGEPFRSQGLAGMDSVFRERAGEGLRWKSVAYTDETHNSMELRTLYDGLKFIYWGYYGSNNLVFHPDNGFVLKNKPVTVYCQNDHFSDIFYTTDGSIPTKGSTPIGDTILITAGSKLTAKGICNQPEYSKTLSGNFPESDVFPTVVPPGSAQPGGWRYDYYLLKDTVNGTRAKPVLSGRTDSTLKAGAIDAPENYVCVYSGFVRTDQTGYYLFATQSLRGLRVYLGKRMIMGLPDSDHVATTSCIVPLAPGFYPIRVEHIGKAAGQKMDLYWAVPVGSVKGKIIKPFSSQEMYSLPIRR